MKNILITGASGDIGTAIAKELAKEDTLLFLQGFRSEEKLKALAEFISREKKCEVKPIICDVSDYVQIEQMFKRIFSECRSLDVLVNNAGISHIGLLQDMKYEEWHNLINTNLSSMFYCCKNVIPGMIEKKEGKIVNVSSMWGNVGASCEVAYSATKGGVNSFSKALAKELAPCNIQVNVIAPGVIDTGMNDFMTDKEKELLISEIPADRMGTPAECGRLVKMIIDAPEYLTGQIITMDGGLL